MQIPKYNVRALLVNYMSLGNKDYFIVIVIAIVIFVLSPFMD